MNQIAQITGLASQVKSGWLKPMFPFSMKAHLFEQEFSLPDGNGGHSYAWKAVCGVEAFSTVQAPMFEAGRWTRCKKCEKQLALRSAA